VKKKYLTAAAILLALTGLATSATLQNHPFSQIFPPNSALDFGGQDVANASRVETAVIEPNASDITFKDNGNVDILVYDDSQGRWELVNSNLYLGGNLDVAGNRIMNVPAPSSTGDAVNKTYVDVSDDTIADDQTLQDVLSLGNDAGSTAIVNLADPTNAQDAATKSYVDNNDATGTDDQTLSEVLTQGNDAGSTAITNLADPSNAQDAATKSYVDTSDDTIADDQTLQDVLSLGNDAGSTAITNLADPSNAQDAATKSYVDNNDATGTDDQTLSVSTDVSGTSDEITIENGNTVTIDDDYEANTDSQSLSVDTTNTDDTISLENGGSVTINDQYEANTDASTKCGSDEVLEGGNTCVSNYEAGDDGDSSSTNEIQTLSGVVSQGNSLGSGEAIDATSGAFYLPTGADSW
jgi:hypothetical protein